MTTDHSKSLHLLPNLSHCLPWSICIAKSISIFFTLSAFQQHLVATGIIEFDAQIIHSTFIHDHHDWLLFIVLGLLVMHTGTIQRHAETSKVPVSAVPTNIQQSATQPTAHTKTPYNDTISMKGKQFAVMDKLPLLLPVPMMTYCPPWPPPHRKYWYSTNIDLTKPRPQYKLQKNHLMPPSTTNSTTCSMVRIHTHQPHKHRNPAPMRKISSDPHRNNVFYSVGLSKLCIMALVITL